MKLQTTVDIAPSKWKIDYADTMLMLGSCYAEAMFNLMSQRNMRVTCNPFGTLYNPLSIAQAINLQPSISNIPLVYHEGLWHSMAHHGAFSRADKAEAEQAVRASVELMQQALKEATVIMVTFGTAWVYEMNGVIVGNCHKLPETSFTRRRLTVEEIVAAWKPILERYPDKHWIFTVSPIRHIKDGLHENQLSKATLLQSIEQLIQSDNQSSNCQSFNRQYFPSYEIMLDELRDYRFYADDLVHPSSLAVNYIWERFTEAYCTPQTRNEMTLQYKRWKHEQHIPLH